MKKLLLSSIGFKRKALVWTGLASMAMAFTATQADAQVVLPYYEDFGGAGPTTTFTTSTVGLNGLSGTGYSWDYEVTGNGRLRLNAGAAWNSCGDRQATMDAAFITSPDPVNYLILNLDMTPYIGATNIQLDFLCADHGEESDVNDRVWVRGSNVDPWIQIVDLIAINLPIGMPASPVTGIDLDDALTSNAQAFSATTQIRFGQMDNFPANTPTASDGFTFDNIQITGGTTSTNDVSATALLSVGGGAGLPCVGGSTVNYLDIGGCSGDFDIDVIVCNNGSNSQSNIPVELVLGGVTYNATVPGPLASLEKDTITITATNIMGADTGLAYLGTIYTNLTGDLVPGNDSTDSLIVTVYDNTPNTQTSYPNLAIPASVGTFSTSQYYCNVGLIDSCNRLECIILDSLFHTWTSVLTVDLESPSGTLIELVATAAGGTGDNMHQVKFSDQGTNVYSINTAGILPGNYPPSDPLSSFWGENGDGEWTLHLNNSSTLGSGTLEKWTMVFKDSRPNLGLDTIVCDESFIVGPGPNFTSYMWDPPNSGAAQYMITQGGTNTYSVTTQDAEGLCTATDEVIVSLGHTIDLGPDQALCEGESFTYDLGPAYSSGTWTGGGTSGANGTTNTVDAVGTYIVTGMDTVGCMDSDTNLITQIYQVQDIDLGDTIEFCDGGFEVLDAGTGFTSYVWENLIQGQTRIVVASGTYSVIAIDANSCTSTDAVEVIVNPLPNIPAGLGAGPTNLIQANPNDQLTFSVPGFPPSSYLWTITNPNAIFTGTDNIPLSVKIGGHVVTLTVTTAAGCTDTETTIVSSYPLGVDNPDAIGSFSVFPNPNNGQFTLMNNGERDVVTLQINDLQGKTLVTQQNVVLENGTGYEIDMTSFSTGMYLVNLIREESVEQIRVVVE